MLGQRRRRWPNITSTFGQRLVFTGRRLRTPYSQHTTLAIISLRRVVWWAQPDQWAGLVDFMFTIVYDRHFISSHHPKTNFKGRTNPIFTYTNLNTKSRCSWANQVNGCVLRLLQLLFFCYEYITLVALTILTQVAVCKLSPGRAPWWGGG